ncbi:MAG: sigma 54-interacting transcriptional regulator [Tissierellia bacterium]|nr:sigma 54-interacting transcriptional regulator [Tissierellia bacterium]
MIKEKLNIDNIINLLPFGILVLDVNGIVTFINEEGIRILNLNPKDILHKKINEIFPDLQLDDLIKEDLDLKFYTAKYNHIDIVLIKKSTLDIGGIKRTCIIFHKKSVYKRFIEYLDDEMEYALLLKTVMETTDDAIVYVDRKGYIRLFNQAYADFLGIRIEDAIGKHVTEVIENTRMHIVVETGIAEYEDVQKIKGKKMIATRIPVFVNGEVVGAVGKVLFKDINELKYLYKKVSKIEKELKLYKNEFNMTNRPKYNLKDIIGESKEILRLKEFTKKIAKSNSNVLILGESGTEKELFAHAIHNNSSRAKYPFIKVNCGAIPYELLESELFGYEEGSFTGAKRGGKIGKIKAADGGTIFLDEIGDLPLSMQVKLLRFIQDKEIEKIGSIHSEEVDVRIVAATNKNLEEMINMGLFRLDLYYRLSVVTLRIPPLRGRKEDIPILSKYLIDKISKKNNIKVDGISEDALEYLKKYDWPGNVRDLENIIERAVNVLDGETIITSKHLPSKIRGIMKNKVVRELKEVIEEAERQAIIDSLIICKGNRTLAAETLGISRTSLYEKMAKYNIKM